LSQFKNKILFIKEEIIMKLIKPAKIDPIEIKKESNFFSKTVSAIVAANLLILGMIYFTIYNG
jgi:hypothetical protein